MIKFTSYELKILKWTQNGKETTSKQKDYVKIAETTGVRSTCLNRAPYESNLQDMDTDKSYLAWIQFIFQDCGGLRRSFYYKYQSVRYSVPTIGIWDYQIWDFLMEKVTNLGVPNLEPLF